MTAIPPQKTQNEIRPPFYTPPGSREGTQLRNENNNSSYKPAPPPRKSAFDIKNHTNPPKVRNIRIQTRPPQVVDVLVVLDFEIPCFRPETLALHSRSLPTNHESRDDFKDGNEGFNDQGRRGRRRSEDFRVALCQIRPFPTLISKIKRLESEPGFEITKNILSCFRARFRA